MKKFARNRFFARCLTAAALLVPTAAFADGTDYSTAYVTALTGSMTYIIGAASATLLVGVGLYSLFYAAWAGKKGLKVGGKG